jgi:hypothetical protein
MSLQVALADLHLTGSSVYVHVDCGDLHKEKRERGRLHPITAIDHNVSSARLQGLVDSFLRLSRIVQNRKLKWCNEGSRGCALGMLEWDYIAVGVGKIRLR